MGEAAPSTDYRSASVRVTHSVDMDLTSSSKASDLGVHCLLGHACPNT